MFTKIDTELAYYKECRSTDASSALEDLHQDLRSYVLVMFRATVI